MGRDAATSVAAPAAACTAWGPIPGPPSGSGTSPPRLRQCSSRGDPRGNARGGERHGRGCAESALKEPGSVPAAPAAGRRSGQSDPQGSGLAGRRGAPAGSVVAGQVDARLHIAGFAAFPRVEISAFPSTARHLPVSAHSGHGWHHGPKRGLSGSSRAGDPSPPSPPAGASRRRTAEAPLPAAGERGEKLEGSANASRSPAQTGGEEESYTNTF